jgi:hypothetical protein
MTDHQDRPDIRQRRRVTQLRKALGLAPVPPHVGAELRTVAPGVCDQLVRVLRRHPAYLALSPDGRMLLLSAVARTIDGFARLVEDRPPQAPPVEAVLVNLLRVEAQHGPCRAAVDAAYLTLREVARVLWPELREARCHAARLDDALDRYTTWLCARTVNAPRAPLAGSAESGTIPDGHDGSLISTVEHRWGAQPVQLYLSVSTLGPANSRRPRWAVAGGLFFVADDHLVTVAEDPTPPRPVPATQPQIVVCIGPVSVSGVAQAHDTALLLLRLIRAGVAAPPSPVLVHVPNLGFLRPSPSEDSVKKITDLLHPLSSHGCRRRRTLARTLQLCLRTATTAQGLAKQLAMHPQTVHNHLSVLRTLYNPDLDFAADNLAMQAAIDLVLPLWELEATGRRTAPPPDGRKLPGSSNGTGGRDLP